MDEILERKVQFRGANIFWNFPMESLLYGVKNKKFQKTISTIFPFLANYYKYVVEIRIMMGPKSIARKEIVHVL